MPIDRRGFIGGSAGLGLALGMSGKAFGGELEPFDQPNILCFVSEDNSINLGCYGDPLARTPNLDAFAERSILFENAFATTPVCGPSRFSIITGLYPASAGSAQNMGSDDTVLPRHFVQTPTPLRQMGYYCTNNSKKNYVSQLDNIRLWDESSRQAHWRNRPEGAPFFAIFNSFTTHESALFHPREGAVEPADVPIPPYLPDTPAVRQDIATYYNSMEVMDGEFAALLAQLEEDGLTDSTVVIYYSDHGGIMPRGKRYANNYGLRVPMLVHVPGRFRTEATPAAGGRVENMASLLDMTATIHSLAGLTTPDWMHGRALLGINMAAPAHYAFGGRMRMDERYDFVRTVTDGRWRYVRNYMPYRPGVQHVTFSWQAASFRDWEKGWLDGTLTPEQAAPWQPRRYEELFDCDADPWNMENLVDRADLAGKLAELSAALDAHMLEINDNGFIPEGCSPEGYTESRWPGAYPLAELLPLAATAGRGEPGLLPELLAALDHENDLHRYWAAQGLLNLGEAVRPALDRMRAAFAMEQLVPTRIVLGEALVALDNDHAALRELGRILEMDDDGPFRLQAINALGYLGEKARPVLPVIRRAAEEDHQHVRNAAFNTMLRLEGRYDPLVPVEMMGGIFPDPEAEIEYDRRMYD